jgi:hypothetical protein
MRKFLFVGVIVTLFGLSACPDEDCCVVCDSGKACGDSCIAKDKTCYAGAGCACNGGLKQSSAPATRPPSEIDREGTSSPSSITINIDGR